jgi:hypothetical protein
LHVSDHLLALNELFVSKAEVITILFFLASKSLLSSFNSFTLTLGHFILVVKVHFSTLSFSVVSHNHRLEHFHLLSAFVGLNISDEFLTHGFISRPDIIIIIPVHNKVF